MNDQLERLIAKAIQQLTGNEPEQVHLEPPADKNFGDLSTNTAMALSKELGKNPREIAQELIDAIPENSIIEKTEIAGPGFVNFWLSNDLYEQAFEELNKKVDQKSFGQLDIGKGKTVFTESGHPNVAKPMGVHHLLSTILGDSISKLLQAGGYEVTKDNYLGDWGTQFGKLIYALQTWGDMDTIQKDPIDQLLKLYVKFHDEAEQDESLEERARENFKKLEDGDEEMRKLWTWIREVSLEEFNKLWARLGVKFDMIHGEAYYEPFMPTVLKKGLDLGVIVEGEGGALIVEMDDPNMPPCLLQKSDGATTYATRDVARLMDYEENYKVDIGIVIVDIAQKLHHDQANEAAQKIGWKKSESVRVHFGRMSFPDGAMSTRKGKVVLLEDVLDEAEKRALEKIKSHNSELPENEQVELARKIGIGAIKYNVLSQNRQKNYTFDWDVMLSFDGNSAPYLQYAYTRTQSLLRKAEESSLQGQATQISSEEEKNLLKKLLDFEHAIERSLTDYKPNHLCTYLFELAQTFSQFYNNLRILDAESTEAIQSRLSLVQATAYVLHKGLELLGIELPERM